jgi:hypothetical protein
MKYQEDFLKSKLSKNVVIYKMETTNVPYDRKLVLPIGNKAKERC